jgi:peptidoglycan/LPS O-acetylase OafA/YrhL
MLRTSGLSVTQLPGWEQWSLSLEFWLYMLAPLLSRLTLRTLIALPWLSLAAFVIHTPLRSLLDLPYYSVAGFGRSLLFPSFCWIGGFAPTA